MDSEKYFEYLVNEALRDVQSFKGWDFSQITGPGRMVESPHKWNYVSKIQPYLFLTNTLLDIGTGGGEILSTLKPLPRLSCAVEDYPPNVEVAKERLEPLGVKVFPIDQGSDLPFSNLPFEDNYFDLVINRHTGYTESEVYRILKPSGHYITQQVSGQTTINLQRILLGDETIRAPNWNLKVAVERLKAHGFKIIEEMEDVGYMRFFDIGAIVYHLIACPWTIENFTVEKYLGKLLDLNKCIEQQGYFDMDYELLFIIAKK
jgi:SAM-dependent methyltransferase